MSNEYLALLMMVIMIICMMMGAHVGLVMGGLAVIFGFLGGGVDTLSLFPDRVFSICVSFPLEAVTLFILMGVILERSGIAERLYRVFHILMGPIKGGLLIATLILAALIAACTGISGASVISIGLIALPSMLKAGYDKKVATGTICSGGGLAVIIPPSLMLILYGPGSGQSISTLFTAAMIPGLLIVAFYILYVVILCYAKPHMGPTLPLEERNKYSTKTKLLMILTSLIPILGLIFTVLGSILFGFASPTEAAAVGAICSLVICAIYGQLTWNTIKTICWSTIRISALIMIIVVGAGVFTTVFMDFKGGDLVANWIISLGLGKLGVTILLLCIIFILGMFMDWVAILMVFLPIVVRLTSELNINPLWFAILFCITLQISYVTPPFSYSVFYLRGITPPGVTLMDIYRGVVPFIPIQIMILVLLYKYPQLALWLPSALR